MLNLHLSPYCHIELSTKEFKAHAHMNHIVFVVNIVIITMLSLCYSIMSYVTLILY